LNRRNAQKQERWKCDKATTTRNCVQSTPNNSGTEQEDGLR
jgi:hypothetical protein